MGSEFLDGLGRLQRAVIEIVWGLGEATVHEVRDRLGRERKLAYTTVLTALQKLEKGGWVKHRSRGKSYVYLPTRTREAAGAKSVRKFVERTFGGDALLMFQHLMSETRLSEAELGELRKMIDDKRKESTR